MKAMTVLVCDDHAVVREGLRLLLETTEDIEVVGEVENGRQAVRETKRLLPDVVLLDLSMPQVNGLEAACQITKEIPSAKLLILSAYTDDQHVQLAVEAGVAGYLTKGVAAEDLLRAIRAIAQGNTFFCPSVAGSLDKPWKDMVCHGSPVATQAAPLTRRQLEVLQLIAEGYCNKQIADALSICAKTVEKHRQELMKKLNIHGIAALTRYAVSLGLVESSGPPHLAS